MQGTPRLYYDDVFLRRFSATVLAHGEVDGRPTAVLDATAFYPESGGQLGDVGTLVFADGEAAVVDVQATEDGVVHHVLDDARPDVGERVEGVLQWARRRIHMALHTGQHILSRALADEARSETVSSRLGERVCTIDVKDELTERQVLASEALANSVVDDDVRVEAFFPSSDELAKLSLRRAPKVDDKIRVVRIGDFDVTPCGGTHCSRSGQVGFVHIIGQERYKGGTRIVFNCGARMRAQLRDEVMILRNLAKRLSCGANEVPSVYDKLRADLASAREALGVTRAELAQTLADSLLADIAPGATLTWQTESVSLDVARQVAVRATAGGAAVAVVGVVVESGVQLIVRRAGDSDFNCGALVKRVASATGGKGGGRPDGAEGRLPAEVAWDQVLKVVAQEI